MNEFIYSSRSKPIEALSENEIISTYLSRQISALDNIQEATTDFLNAARSISIRLERKGRIVFIGAGMSGMVARLIAAEWPTSYTFPADKLHLIVNSDGRPFSSAMVSMADEDLPPRLAVGEIALSPNDVAIGLSASGTTTFTIGAMEEARLSGAFVVGISSQDSQAMKNASDINIVLDCGDSLMKGSLALTPATQQKCALDILSLLINIQLGNVYRSRPVNFRADNERLRQRAIETVMDAASVTQEKATQSLDQATWEIKPAVLLAAGAEPSDVDAILRTARYNLRAALLIVSERSVSASRRRQRTMPMDDYMPADGNIVS